MGGVDEGGDETEGLRRRLGPGRPPAAGSTRRCGDPVGAERLRIGRGEFFSEREDPRAVLEREPPRRMADLVECPSVEQAARELNRSAETIASKSVSAGSLTGIDHSRAMVPSVVYRRKPPREASRRWTPAHA